MSVIVKGMKMPENCIKCPFAENVPPGRTRCLIMWRWLAEGYNAPSPERNEHCPLVALPDTHGDLIDRDEFKETLDYYIREAGWSDEHNEALTWVKDDFIDAEMIIVEAEGER